MEQWDIEETTKSGLGMGVINDNGSIGPLICITNQTKVEEINFCFLRFCHA